MLEMIINTQNDDDDDDNPFVELCSHFFWVINELCSQIFW